MASFAELDANNVVLRVLKVRNEDVNNLEMPDSEPVGIAYLEANGFTLPAGHSWKQTSAVGAFRKNYGVVGSTYYPDIDAFVRVKPRLFPSWVLNTNKAVWEAPVPRPSDVNTGNPPKRYMWDEPTLSWVEVPNNTASAT